MKNVVAIDGPAGSGKSTVAKIAADKLGFIYLDTGAMYRALTLKAMKANANLENESEVEKFVRDAHIEFEKGKVYLDDNDVTAEIRSSKVTRHVPTVAAYPAVRSIMLIKQRNLADKSNGIVMEGRDIGTVVFPDARWKFYIDAKPEVRAKRRHAELTSQGKEKSLEEVLTEIKERDFEDSTRAVAPLKKADDALLIDTTEMTIEEVTEKIVEEVIKKKAYSKLW